MALPRASPRGPCLRLGGRGLAVGAPHGQEGLPLAQGRLQLRREPCAELARFARVQTREKARPVRGGKAPHPGNNTGKIFEHPGSPFYSGWDKDFKKDGCLWGSQCYCNHWDNKGTPGVLAKQSGGCYCIYSVSLCLWGRVPGRWKAPPCGRQIGCPLLLHHMSLFVPPFDHGQSKHPEKKKNPQKRLGSLFGVPFWRVKRKTKRRASIRAQNLKWELLSSAFGMLFEENQKETSTWRGPQF